MFAPPVIARRLTAVTLIVAAVALPAACDVRQPSGRLGSLADLSGLSYVVGSKDFDEQIVLCHLTSLVLRDAGAEVTDRCNTGTTEQTRAALERGDISLYWEYTGTAWADFMAQSSRPSDAEMLRAVRERDLRTSGIVWLDPSSVNNTYAFAMAARRAAELRIHTISDMFAYLRSDRPGAVCLEQEYASRDDGMRGLQAAYGGGIPPSRIHVLNKDVVYQATADDVCQFGEVYSTDGRVLDLDLALLTDDRLYHVTYAPTPTIRDDILRRGPQVAAVLNGLSAALDHRSMLELNSRVSAGHEPPEEIARTWLTERGLIAD